MFNRIIISLFILLVAFTSLVLPQNVKSNNHIQNNTSKEKSVKKSEVKPKITFVELGSVNCIPCKKMQPVMKAVEKKYGSQIKVVFYDVWKDDQKHYAEKYEIRLIPTQVFLDENGKEFFRHEGFYPEGEIDKLLKSKGIKPKS